MKGIAMYLYYNSPVALPFLLYQLSGDLAGWGGYNVGVVNLALPRKGKECCLTANVCGAWLSRAFLWSRSLAGGWLLWLCKGLGVSKQGDRNEGMGETFSGMQKRQQSCCWHAAIFHCLYCLTFRSSFEPGSNSAEATAQELCRAFRKHWLQTDSAVQLSGCLSSSKQRVSLSRKQRALYLVPQNNHCLTAAASLLGKGGSCILKKKKERK